MKRVLLLLGLAACSATPPPATVVDGSPKLPGTVLEPLPPTTPDDPRLVRCGVDDAPRSVISGRLPTTDDRGAKRFLADRAVPPPPGARSPVQMPVPTAPPGPPPPPWHPTARITVGIAHDGAGAPLDGALVQAARSLVPAFVTCLPLRTEGDLGEQSIQVSLAASGAPLWALPTLQAQPTLFGRCLLEQSCHFRGPTASIGRSVWVPVKAALDLPPEPPGPGQAARVTVTMDGAGSSADVGRQVLESAARACASQARLLRETRFTVRISAARGAEIATSSPDGSAPARDPLVGCTVAQIAARIPPKTRGNGFSGVVRWEP